MDALENGSINKNFNAIFKLVRADNFALLNKVINGLGINQTVWNQSEHDLNILSKPCASFKLFKTENFEDPLLNVFTL